MRTIRASEIGSYFFCARAWWYRLQGIQPENQAELTAGMELHRAHGRRVIAAGFTQALALFLMLIALVLLAAFCTARML